MTIQLLKEQQMSSFFILCFFPPYDLEEQATSFFNAYSLGARGD